MNRIDPISMLTPKLPENTVQKNGSFGDAFNNLLKDMNSTIKNANTATENMVAGKVNDVHEVMIAMEKASVSLNLAVEIRNRVLESYREIMRMQA
jgi:flagellar hook-basal body complex protein FliE